MKNTALKIFIIFGFTLFGYLIGSDFIHIGDSELSGHTLVKPAALSELITGDKVQVVNGNNRAKSVVWTNLGPEIFEESDTILAIPIDEPIYDLGFSFYSDWYAEKYGFPKSHVRKLPEHVQFMGYRMKTEGRMKDCTLKMLLDKELGLNVPEYPFSPMLGMGSPDDVNLVRPRRLPEWKETEGIRAFRMKWKGFSAKQGSNNKYIFRNAFITTVPYAPSFKKKKSGKLLSVYFDSYSPWFYEGLDYVSIAMTCSALTQVLHEQEEFFVWLKKKSGKDYTRFHSPEREDFLVFKVPMELRRKILEFMKTGRSEGRSLYGEEFRKFKEKYSNGTAMGYSNGVRVD